ncbi:Right handed beta helix region [Histomonas meleagridis]|uniref:Right handed beta helix region n=1 Tax=Histomonas meleagridis TaxID=135588 RepID=UPI003559FD2B|nr:Right handed beta helix region [Histomonas meleagridis]KAH0802255.1 Right handed beta helix region [Histomonas meleagridis]
MFLLFLVSEQIVRFPAGDYFFTSRYTVESNTHYIAEKGSRFIGAKKLRFCRKLTDGTVRERIDESVRGQVWECDLRQNLIQNPEYFKKRGFGGNEKGSHAQLYIDGVQMNVPQYPKFGEYLRILNTTTSVQNVGFRFNNTHLQNWASLDDIWAFGMWNYDWAANHMPVTITNDTAKVPYNVQGTQGQRFFFYHILEEMTSPGEFYLDYNSLMVYFIPPSQSFNEVLLSTFTDNMFYGTNVENVTIEGFNIESTIGQPISITGNNITIKDVHMKYLGTTCMSLSGHDISLESSTFETVFDGCVTLSGGDRETLTSYNNRIYNCSFDWFGNWSRVYKPAVSISGVGINVTHCKITHCHHEAFAFSGNNHLIEYNEFANILMDTNDAGVIYSGRDYTVRGTTIRRNYFHDNGVKGRANVAVYNDDCLSETYIHENIFVNNVYSTQMGGGRDFVLNNNIFINNTRSFWYDDRCGRSKTNKETLYQRYVDLGYANSSLWFKTYPGLRIVDSKFKESGIDMMLNSSGTVGNWVSLDGGVISKGVSQEWTFGKMYNVTEDDFVDFQNGIYTLKAESDAAKDGFPIIDINEIGLVKYVPESKGLSNGTIAGIVIGCLIFVAIVIMIVIIFKKKKSY